MDADDMHSLDETTQSHTISEGVGLQKNLYFKVYSAKDMPWKNKLNLLFDRFVTPKILLVIWGWFIVQFFVAPLLGVPIGSDQWVNFFTVSGSDIWTIGLLTYMIGHSGFTHIVVNSIVLFSFGLIVERYFSPRGYIAFFVLSGLAAVFGQVVAIQLLSPGPIPPVIGASGAISAIVGFFAVKQPNSKIYMFFLIPVKTSWATALFLIGSIAVVAVWGVGAFGFGHSAHAAGLLFGIAVGFLWPRDNPKGLNISLPSSRFK